MITFLRCNISKNLDSQKFVVSHVVSKEGNHGSQIHIEHLNARNYVYAEKKIKWRVHDK